ncbi:MAG: alkaline phosphatase family protein, partial [Anaerolineae bacterium]|nr:alkaline phosphatase family protein [Anaerolineae bacterium]
MMRKVLVIGLDGATFDLLAPWIEMGRLPTLARLIEEGVSGALESTSPPISSAAWVSFATGKNPGKHGVVDFVHPEENGYRVTIVSSKKRGSKALWNLVSEAGGQVGVVGVPVTYPPEEVNGFMISDFLTPSSKSDYTYPLSLRQELDEKLGGFQLLPSEKYRSTSSTDRFIEDMIVDIEKRTEAVVYLMGKPWDLFACVFWSPDMMQHEVWRLLDKSHPQHDPAAAQAYGDKIIAFYERLDDCVRRILDEVGEEVTVVVMSDHGFGPTHNFFLVNTWLQKIGLLRLKRGPLALAKYLMFKVGFTPLNAFRIAKALRLGFLRRWFRFQRGGRLMKRLFLSFSDVDWSQTKAFAVGSFGQIYINLAGRRRQGIVQPEEYEEVREEIIEKALEICDPYSGEPVVERAYRREELYFGDYLERMPDIILVPRRYEYMAFGHADFGSHRLVEPIFGLS